MKIKTIFRPELFAADIASVAQPIHVGLYMVPDVVTHTRRGLATLKAGKNTINFLIQFFSLGFNFLRCHIPNINLWNII